MQAHKSKIIILPLPPCLRSGFMVKIVNYSLLFVLRKTNFLKTFPEIFVQIQKPTKYLTTQNWFSSTFPCFNLTYLIIKSHERTFAIVKWFTINIANCPLLFPRSLHFSSKTHFPFWFQILIKLFCTLKWLNMFLLLKPHKVFTTFTTTVVKWFRIITNFVLSLFLFYGKQPSLIFFLKCFFNFSVWIWYI